MIWRWMETLSDGTQHYSLANLLHVNRWHFMNWKVRPAIRIILCTERRQNYAHRILHHVPVDGRLRKLISLFQKRLIRDVFYALPLCFEVRAHRNQVRKHGRNVLITPDSSLVVSSRCKHY